MKKSKSLLTLVGLVGLLLVPVSVHAATDTDTTTVEVAIGETISVSTSTTVSINVVPVSGGSQSSESDTVTVATNSSSGYELTLENADADTDLEDGSNTIAAHAGTFAAPSALANNSWGYAVAGAGSFDASYSALDNVTTSTSLWAGVPGVGSSHTIASSNGPEASDQTTVWYSVKADTSKPSGTYTDTVLYTATTL